MVKSICLLAIVCSSYSAATAQKNEIISLQPKRVTISSSCFSNVEVVDTRLDTSNLGFIQRGLLNRRAFVTTSRPLKEELASMVTTLIKDASKQDGTLLINLRQFKLSEFDGKGGENGVLRLSAVFYLKRESMYRKLFTVNTNVVTTSLDITERLLDTVPEILGAYIKQAAGHDTAKTDSASPFTARHWDELDELEKNTIPAYNVDLLQKGLYTTFDEFRNNRPAAQPVIVEMDASDKPVVYEMKPNGKRGRQIKTKNFFAVCDGEKMFFAGQYALYAMSKRDNDFYFRGIGKESGDGSQLVQGQTIILGRSGELPPDLKFDWSMVVFKIDHITGRIIPVRIVED